MLNFHSAVDTFIAVLELNSHKFALGTNFTPTKRCRKDGNSLLHYWQQFPSLLAAVSFITGSSLFHYWQQSPSSPITCIMRHVGWRILEQPLAAWLSQTEPANRLFSDILSLCCFRLVQCAAAAALGSGGGLLLGITDHLKAHSQPQMAQYTNGPPIGIDWLSKYVQYLGFGVD